MRPEQARLELRSMLESIRHEAFYVTGTWVDESLGVYVGWCVQKGSFSDGMPLLNERGDLVLAFSGDEFPEPGIVRGLQERGHTVDPEGPSYLVHVAEDDASFPASLNGRFHGLLIDLPRRTTTLFNDRYGMHRLYYHESKEAFYFAAEAKAIMTVRPELRKMDLRAYGELISCGCVLENRTLFDRIQVLPGASTWIFQNGSLEKKGSYFQPSEWEDQELLEPEAYYREVRDVFARNLPRYFASAETTAVSLTGGLDTRMIMAWHQASPGSLPCYTFGGMFRDCQDVVVARKVAALCGQHHEVIPVGEEFLSRFPHYAARSVFLSDGCVDVGHAADLYLNERARAIAPVRITGLYGGEVLRRVRAFKPREPLAGLFGSELVSHVRDARETYSGLLRQHPLTFAAFQQAPWHHYGNLSLEQTQLTVRTPYLDNDFVRTVYRSPASACLNNDVCLRLIADSSAALRRLRTDRGLGGTLPPLAAGLSHGFLEFLFKAEYAYDYGMPQPVAQIDHLFSALRLERLFLGRHKIFHFRLWYRDALSNYVREVLLDPKTLSRSHIDRKRVETIVHGHLKGNRNYTTEIHQLLTLELLHEQFLDAQPAAAAIPDSVATSI
jgi:asparagine synthase (glutamine-hydrolysing)